MMLRTGILLSLALIARAGTIEGGNSTYRGDVAPLVDARPDLAGKLKNLKLADVGEATRISRLRSTTLAGRNVGPYEFRAVNDHGRDVTVRFRTRQFFVNSFGVVVAEYFNGDLVAGGDISHAVAVREELVGITIDD